MKKSLSLNVFLIIFISMFSSSCGSHWRYYSLTPIRPKFPYISFCVCHFFFSSQKFKILPQQHLELDLNSVCYLSRYITLRFFIHSFWFFFVFVFLMQSFYQEYAKLKAKYDSLQITQRLCHSEYSLSHTNIYTYIYIMACLPICVCFFWC